MARDETAESEPGRDSEVAEFAVDSAAPAEPVPGPSSIDERVEPAEKAQRERALALRTNRAAGAELVLSRGAVADCDVLRREAGVAPAGPESADARYRLAVCSLLRHEGEATEELEALAVKDAEAFLALESEGTRADQVRTLLRRIKPD